jgi:hypothetical protein
VPTYRSLRVCISQAAAAVRSSMLCKTRSNNWLPLHPTPQAACFAAIIASAGHLCCHIHRWQALLLPAGDLCCVVVGQWLINEPAKAATRTHKPCQNLQWVSCILRETSSITASELDSHLCVVQAQARHTLKCLQAMFQGCHTVLPLTLTAVRQRLMALPAGLAAVGQASCR